MAIDKAKAPLYTARIIKARMNLLTDHGFYGMLLMHLRIKLDESLSTAATDGIFLYFNPDFLDGLTDSELRFVMLHEVMHVVFDHVSRGRNFDHELYNIAADIVVNSNILKEFGGDLRAITVCGEEAMHIAPDGCEGSLYTAEKVYEMLKQKARQGQNGGKAGGSGGSGGGSGKGPQSGSGGQAAGGFELGRAEQRLAEAESILGQAGGFVDDHSKWVVMEQDSTLRSVWVKNIVDAAKAIEIQNSTFGRGRLPAFAQRILKQLGRSQLDWRRMLADFVQEEIVDYSFAPPDRRFRDSGFFLPDLNAPEDKVEDILFMIDTSGSVDDEVMTKAFAEVKGAIEQFDGRLKGWLGFFDAAIYKPEPFETVEELMKIKPAGGGGTDFQIVFEYVREYMQEKPPSSIIILTDGYAPFPQEELANGIPVLWLISSDIEPPWGKYAQIEL